MEKQQSTLTDWPSEYASMHSVSKDINQRGHAGVGDIFNYESSNVEASLASCQVLLLKRWKSETEHQWKHTERQVVSLEDREWPQLVYRWVIEKGRVHVGGERRNEGGGGVMLMG